MLWLRRTAPAVLRVATLLAVTVGMVTLTPAMPAAQDRNFHLNFGGGPTLVFGDFADGFSTGWGPAVGATFDVNPTIGARVEYAYGHFRLRDDVPFNPAQGVLDANHSMHQIDLNLVATSKPYKRVRGYALAGPGMYYRSVTIARYEGSGRICNPLWYVCGTYPIESIPGSRGGWDLGMNIGGGVTVPFGGGEFYVEGRYHYVWGPEFEEAKFFRTRDKKNGKYWPITFGFRF